jgi:hypothetical protein
MLLPDISRKSVLQKNSGVSFIVGSLRAFLEGEAGKTSNLPTTASRYPSKDTRGKRTMYFLHIYFENSRWNGTGEVCFSKNTNEIAKWTLLSSEPSSQELLRLIATACAGIRLCPRLLFAFQWRKMGKFNKLLGSFPEREEPTVIELD